MRFLTYSVVVIWTVLVSAVPMPQIPRTSVPAGTPDPAMPDQSDGATPDAPASGSSLQPAPVAPPTGERWKPPVLVEPVPGTGDSASNSASDGSGAQSEVSTDAIDAAEANFRRQLDAEWKWGGVTGLVAGSAAMYGWLQYSGEKDYLTRLYVCWRDAWDKFQFGKRAQTSELFDDKGIRKNCVENKVKPPHGHLAISDFYKFRIEDLKARAAQQAKLDRQKKKGSGPFGTAGKIGRKVGGILKPKKGKILKSESGGPFNAAAPGPTFGGTLKSAGDAVEPVINAGKAAIGGALGAAALWLGNQKPSQGGLSQS